jgi:hypothetical protein
LPEQAITAKGVNGGELKGTDSLQVVDYPLRNTLTLRSSGPDNNILDESPILLILPPLHFFYYGKDF